MAVVKSIEVFFCLHYSGKLMTI